MDSFIFFFTFTFLSFLLLCLFCCFIWFLPSFSSFFLSLHLKSWLFFVPFYIRILYTCILPSQFLPNLIYSFFSVVCLQLFPLFLGAWVGGVGGTRILLRCQYLWLYGIGCKITSEKWTGKGTKESGCSLFQETVQTTAWKDWVKAWKKLMWIAGVQAGTGTEYLSDTCSNRYR
jgi:hypothetical protein